MSTTRSANDGQELQVTAIPAFQDNYIWILHRPDCADAWVVDPGDPMPIEEWLTANNKELAGILITHHHRDHIGGVATLSTLTDNIYGPARDIFVETRHPCVEGDQVEVLGETFRALDIPGHTANHIGWFGETSIGPLLFCGDTLFSAGCGRLLGGTASQLFNSLNRLQSLPDDTLVYCTHEYTIANLKFALAVDPDNSQLSEWQRQATNLREKGHITLPTRLGDEKQYNPFLRVEQASISQSVAAHTGFTMESPEQVFTELRRWKDQF